MNGRTPPFVATRGAAPAAVFAAAVLAAASLVLLPPAFGAASDGAAGAPAADHAGPPAVNANLPVTTLTIRGHRLVVEIASTPAEREIGLMNRFSLQPDHGMLFVFEDSQPLAFWMKNTFVALSVAYVDANGRILNIEAMAPQDLTTHWSQGPARYAIEMRQGWFLDHGIGPGDTVGGLGTHASRR